MDRLCGQRLFIWAHKIPNVGDVAAAYTAKHKCLVVGMNRHSNRHPSEEGQVAFKVLMTHVLRVA